MESHIVEALCNVKDVTKAKRTTLLQDTFVATTYNQHNSITKHAQKEVCTLELHVQVNIYRMLEPHLELCGKIPCVRGFCMLH